MTRNEIIDALFIGFFAYLNIINIQRGKWRLESQENYAFLIKPAIWPEVLE